MDSCNPEEGVQRINKGNLPTILDLAGTLVPIRKLDDIESIVNSTTRWFVLGQAKPAVESFQKGLSALGVLDAVKAHPDAFRAVFCNDPQRDYFGNHGDLVRSSHKSSLLKQSNHRKPGPLPLARLFTRLTTLFMVP